MSVAERRATFLSSFVPLTVQRVVAGWDSVPDEPQEVTIRAAGFAADIVGSTALGELLDVAHDVGADVLSSALQRMFGGFERIVSKCGGEIVHLAGDGLFALWPVSDTDDLAGAVASAVRCGLLVQEELAGERVDADHRLSFRVGVAAGEFWVPMVGGAGQWSALFGGDPVEQLAGALTAARPGEVVVSDAAARYLGDNLTSSSAGGAMRAIGVEPLPYSAPPVDGVSDVLGRFVLEHVASRADESLLGRFAELRDLTSVFVKVRGVAPGQLQRLQHITTAFQRTVRRYGGAMTISLLDENGLSLVGTWGGSHHAYEDNQVRALRTALEFAGEVGDGNLGIGVSTGRTFTGDVVAESSRRFLILGRAINLAARLATADPGAEVRCDVDTMMGARRNVVFEEQAALHLKGVEGETRLFRPVASIDPASEDRSGLVGRFHEREVLTTALARLAEGKGGTVVIEGEAGIGKSALVQHLLLASEPLPIRRLVLRGSSLERSTPLHPWRTLFGKLIDSGRVEEAVASVLEDGESGFVGLLAGVLPVAASLSEEVQGLDPGGRGEAMRGILARLFVRTVSGAPLLFVVEDAHWLDSATWALLEDVVARLPGALVVLVTRGGTEADPAEGRLRRDAQLLPVGLLDMREMVALVCERLDVAAIPDDFTRMLIERTDGHPLFTEEIVRSLRDSGVIEISGPTREVKVDMRALGAASVPSSVLAVIGSRVDRLPLAHQATLKVASVIGRRFTAADVLAIHPERPSVTAMASHLADAVEAGLIKGDADDADLYRFAHALTTDATYALLPAEQRKAIHSGYARLLHDRGSAEASLLAHHHESAEEGLAAEEALHRAAEEAFGTAAYREVVDLLARLDRLDVPAQSALVSAWRESMAGRARVGLGDLSVGRDHLLAATRLAGMPMPVARWRLVLGLLGQALRQMLHRLTPLPRMVSPGDKAETIEVGAAAYFAMATMAYGLDPAGWLYVCLRCTNEAERLPPTRALVDGYAFLSYALGLVGRESTSARYVERALSAAAAIDSPTASGEALLFNAVMLLTVGEWDSSVQRLQEARVRFEEAGNRRLQAQAVSVSGYVFIHRGDFDGALEAYARVATIETDDRLVLAWRLRGAAQAHLRKGDVTGAVGRLQSLLPLAREVGERPTILSTLGLLAEGLWQQGRRDAAVELAQEGLGLMEGVESLAATHAVDGYVAVTRVLLDAAAHHESDLLPWAVRAVRSLRKASRRLPIAEPRAAMAQAMLDARAGKTAHARRGFEKAFESAELLRLPYDAALVEFEMGRELDDRDALARAEAQWRAMGALEDAKTARSLQPAG